MKIPRLCSNCKITRLNRCFDFDIGATRLRLRFNATYSFTKSIYIMINRLCSLPQALDLFAH